MAFRDDREAQLQRAAALERENERLRRELEEREAAERAEERTERASLEREYAAKREKLEREHAAKREKLERENDALRDKLERARGPGLARRVVAQIVALRLREPSGDGGYARAALLGWRLYAPALVGLAIPAIADGGVAAWALAAFAVGTPALASLVLLVPWALGRRRRVTAGAITGAVIGVAFSAALAAWVFLEGMSGRDYVLTRGAAVYTTLLLMVVTRGAPLKSLVGAPAYLLLLMPHPGHALIWVMLGALGARLADPASWKD